MSVETIRVILGQLQDDPESETAFNELTEIVTAPTPSGTSPSTNADMHRLLEQARARHEQKREWGAVARMLELEIALLGGGREEASMQGELARIYDEELLDSVKARDAYRTLLTMSPSASLNEKAQTFIEEDDGKRAKWTDVLDRYLAEAEGASDDAFKSVLYASAADVAHRYSDGNIAREAIVNYLDEAIRLDPKNRRAHALMEILHRASGDHEALARSLALVVSRAPGREDRVAAGLKLGRLASKVLQKTDMAIDAYQKVLDVQPGQADALSYLAEAYGRTSDWDHLVALYEDQLKSGLRGEAEFGALLQVAMVHWKMRGKPEAAEPYFDRVRRLDATHGGMLAFFREVLNARGETSRLATVLTDAQRATSDAGLKKDLATEIAKLAEAQDDAHKAIEQYRTILKADPENQEARDALKRLYEQAGTWTPLVELLRHELDRIPADQVDARSALLREIASIHRDKHKNEQALVSTLVQLTQVDEKDASAVRELIKIYEGLGRFRELINCQTKLADLTDDREEKAELHRSAARRWFDQFSNVQNAIASFEGLLAVKPEDTEARQKLRELYGKRRSWPQLYALYEIEVKDAEGKAKVELLHEMAKLAAERLDRGSDAISLYRQILEIEPQNFEIFDQIEKQAEREKDFAAVADILEQRALATTDDAARLALLQRLGGVYETRLREPSKAAETWKRVLDLSPGHTRALRVLRESYLAAGELDKLEALYEKDNEFEALADFLSAAAEKAQGAAKVSISFRAANVYAQRLHAPERAARSYERILSVEPQNLEAVGALIPIYEQEERWARLPALYEVRVNEATSPSDKVALLRKLVQVTGVPLADKASALKHARRVYEAAPDDESLELLESWSRQAASWGPFVEAIDARLRSSEEIERDHKRALRLKLADAYARELGRVDDAVLTYRGLVEEDPSDLKTNQAFEQLLRGAERRDDLRWLFGVRVENASPEEKGSIYEEWATLEEDVFGNQESAIDLYRKAASVSPGSTDPLRALSRLLLLENKHGEAAEVIERYRDLSTGDSRAERELELASLYLGDLNEPGKALVSAEAALEQKPHDPDAVRILGQLMDLPSTRERAARLLVSEYRELGDARREASALSALMAFEKDPPSRVELHLKLADVEDKQLSEPATAFATTIRALNEAPDEIVLWDRSVDLAKRAGRPTDLAEAYRLHLIATGVEDRRISRDLELVLCERAALLHDTDLGDSDGAMPYLKRILAMDPANDRAFERLKQILTGAERWPELEELFEQAAQTALEASTRIQLLGEIALISEEVIGDNAKAIRYHERIAEIDPLHIASLDALEKLYEEDERFEDLGKLLERRLETSEGDEAVDIRLYLARLYHEQLHRSERALDHIEVILRERPEDPDARQLAEKLLEVEPLRIRTATLLEMVYENRDDIRSLVQMIELRLPAATNDDERREMLRRISELKDERLHDDTGAFDALSKRLPLDPEDTATRERFIEIGKRLGRHADVVSVLAEAADKAPRGPVRAEILMQLAATCENALVDSARAEVEYRKVIDTDPTDPAIVLPAAAELARLYTSRSAHGELAEVLGVQVKLEESLDKRAALCKRLGELYETDLHDPASAVDAYRLLLADDPASDVALSSLERLYEVKKDWRELVAILRAREESTDDGEERKRVMVKAAETLGGPANDANEAIGAWRAVLDAFGPEASTLTALASLYEKTERYTDLAETLEVALSLAEDDKEKVALLGRLGDVRRQHQQDHLGALDAYRQALDHDRDDARARVSLEALLEDPDARRSAAEILHPLYEQDGDNEKLLKVLDIEALTADSPATRVETLDKAVSIAEETLKDPARAYEYACRAVKEAASEETFTSHMETLERLTKTTGRYADTFALYRGIVSDILDGDAQQDVLVRLGQIAEENIEDRALAIEFYKRALEVRGDDKRALVPLERLYQGNDANSLLDIVKRRVEAEENTEEKVALLFRQAELHETDLQDPEGAISTLETVLDFELDPRATAKLEVLYQKRERHADLVALYERLIDKEPSAETRVKIARVSRSPLGDTPRAFDELSAALDLSRESPEAIAELEAIMSPDEATSVEPEDRARAASMLEGHYLKRADWKKLLAALETRLSASQDPSERSELLGRVALLYEEQLEDYGAALDTVAKLLHEDVGDEKVWSELERLARVASAERDLAKIYAAELGAVGDDDGQTAKLARRTGEIFFDLAKGSARQPSDVDDSLTWYRRAHKFEPDSEEIFSAIDAILEKEGRPAERADLYEAVLDYRDGDKRITALHTLGALYESKLDAPEKAVESYRAALDVDPNDELSLDHLTALYKRLERHQDLADLYQTRVDGAETAEKASVFRLELAKLLSERLDDKSGAIDQLEAVVTELPWNKEAIAALEQLGEGSEKARVVDILLPLYERSDDWRPLVKIAEDRLSLANDPKDRAGIHMETARIWETRGGDLQKAFASTKAAFDADPGDVSIRENLERLAGEVNAMGELADAYEHALEHVTDDFERREILTALARIYDQRVDDPRKALVTYERIYALDTTDVGPLDKVDELSTLLGDWTKVVEVLTKKTDQASDAEAAEVHRRIARVELEMLDDGSAAVASYEQSLTLEPDHVETTDRLLELYEARETEPGAERRTRPEGRDRLVELYARRIELAGDDEADLKHTLRIKSATRLETMLGDPREAIVLFEAAREDRPEDREVLRSLARLYRGEQMWHELLDNLRAQAAMAESTDQRVETRVAIGSLLQTEIDDREGALAEYRLVLEDIPEHADAARRVFELAESHEDLRLEASEILLPVLAATGRNADRVRLLRLKLTALSDPNDRGAVLKEIATILDRELDQAAEAETALLSALAEMPDDPVIHGELERLSEKTDGFGRYADELEKRATAETMDMVLARSLWARLGSLAETRLNDDARAVEAYKKAIESVGDEPDLLDAIDRLYGRLGKDRELADVLERKISIVPDADHAELYYRLAKLQIGAQREPTLGLGSLRAAVERDPAHAGARVALEELTENSALFEEVAETLEDVYKKADDSAALARLFEKRIKFAPTASDRVRMRLELAKVFEDRVRDSGAAHAALLIALTDDPQDSEVLSEIERLSPVVDGWKSAVEALESATRANVDLSGDVASDLWIRAATWRRDKLEDDLGAEKSFEEALVHDDQNVVIVRAVEQLQRSKGRERELVKTLLRLAKLEGPQSASELRREGTTLADQLGDDALGESILREMIAADEADAWALGELTKKRAKAGDHAEVFKLLVRRAELTADAAAIRELWREAAVVARDELKSDADAIQYFEQIFEDMSTDTDASTALRALYAKNGQKKELLKHLERLVDVADTSSDRSRLRLEAAEISEELDQHSEAIDLLQAILDEEPSHRDATVLLSKLLEKTGRDDDLATLLEKQIELASLRGDRDAEINYRMRASEVYESRLGDVDRATDVLVVVLERDPASVVAMDRLAALAEKKGDRRAAADHLERSLALRSGDEAIATVRRLASLYDALSDEDGVRRVLERALSIRQDPELRERLRTIYEKQKAYPELAQHIVVDARAAADDKEKVRLFKAAADLQLSKLSQPSAAAEILLEASLVAPTDRDLLLALSDAESAAGHGQKAIEALQKVVESFGGRRSKELSPIHHRIAKAYLTDGDKKKALSELDSAFKLDPGSVVVLRDLGLLALELADSEPAEKDAYVDRAGKTFKALLLQKLDDHSPITKAEVFHYLGEVHHRQGDDKKAIQMLERAVDTDKNLAKAKDLLKQLKG